MLVSGKAGEGLSGPEGRAVYSVCREDVPIGAGGHQNRAGEGRTDRKGDTQPCHRQDNCPARRCLPKVKGLLGEGRAAEKGGCPLDTSSALWRASSCAGLCKAFIYLLLQRYSLRPHYGRGTKATQRGIRHTFFPQRAYSRAGDIRHVPEQTEGRK